jgi:iron complex transport system substrate-binding protein
VRSRAWTVLVLLAAAACQGAPAASIPATPAVITLVDDEGTTVTLQGTPQKVVSLTPATTELLFALGEGDRLVGRTDFDDFPPEATEIAAVASFQGVEIEQVVEIDPDLVLAGGNSFTPPADVARLRELGFAVLVLYAADVGGVLADIRLVGRALGVETKAGEIVAEIQGRIEEVSAAVAGLRRPRTFYEIGNEPELYGPAPDSFVADMVSLAGGDPITTTDPAVFSIAVERLVSVDPEVIILGDAAYGVCPDVVATRPGWASITAVSEGAVRPVDDIVVTRPGPRLGEGLAALALAIHPDAAIAPPTAGATYCAEAGMP